MTYTACLVCLDSTVKAKNVALIASTQQNLSNLFLEISMGALHMNKQKIRKISILMIRALANLFL
jgi:hypothetical protein